MKWVEMTSPVPGMRLWGSLVGSFTFVISTDPECAPGLYPASVKIVGATPWDGTRRDLGIFDSFKDAEKACKDFIAKKDA